VVDENWAVGDHHHAPVAAPYPHAVGEVAASYPHAVAEVAALYLHAVAEVAASYLHAVAEVAAPYPHAVAEVAAPYPHAVAEVAASLAVASGKHLKASTNFANAIGSPANPPNYLFADTHPPVVVLSDLFYSARFDEQNQKSIAA